MAIRVMYLEQWLIPSAAMISALPHLHGRAARPQFYNKPKFLLAPDPKYAPPILSIELNQNAQPWPRSSLSALSNQQFIAEIRVEGKWSCADQDTFNTLRCPRGGGFPLPPILEDILRMEPELSPRSILRRASDVTASVAHEFFNPLKSGHGTVHNPRKRKVKTPFPPYYNDQRESGRVLVGAVDAPRKRVRIGKGPDPTSLSTAPTLKPSKRQHEELRPLAGWLTVVLYDMIVLPLGASLYSINQDTKERVESRILDILSTYTPENAIIMAAVWYISRLFSGGIIAAEFLVGSDAIELMVRIFTIGLLLAWKWLHDSVIKTKCWMNFVSLTCESINKLEKTALKMLNYDIRISPGQWKSWLSSLRESTRRFSQTRDNCKCVHTVINDLLSSARQGCEVYIPEPNTPPITSRFQHELHSKVTEGLSAFNGCLSRTRKL
ncbi:hypothetical protein BDZ94DRAFT_547600 [Collybia nuda]|uniref:Uncharacterized protein n=1 Tax=Collybia nuda TaxID=64659 RepID=A0A9P6CQQ0_9AGAR|nr:hypothetical protein BDZ94DRAFT_547600 [Collybia nuda]